MRLLLKQQPRRARRMKNNTHSARSDECNRDAKVKPIRFQRTRLALTTTSLNLKLNSNLTKPLTKAISIPESQENILCQSTINSFAVNRGNNNYNDNKLSIELLLLRIKLI